MRNKISRFLIALCVVAALLAVGFFAARGASFSAQNNARLCFLAAVVVASVAFSWPGALLAALGGSAFSVLAMQDALRANASTRAPFLAALWLDIALFFGFGILAALLTHDRHRFDDMAFRDEASGLLLWPRLQERLAEELQRARADASPLALLLIEADEVAGAPDENSAENAAQRRRELAQVVAQCARVEDIAGIGPPRAVASHVVASRAAARLAGMKRAASAPCFAVVLPRTAPSGAQALAERIVEGVRRQARLVGAPQSVSCGIVDIAARANRATHRESAILVEQVEEALSEAQRTGRGRIVFFDAEMRAN